MTWAQWQQVVDRTETAGQPDPPAFRALVLRVLAGERARPTRARGGRRRCTANLIFNLGGSVGGPDGHDDSPCGSRYTYTARRDTRWTALRGWPGRETGCYPGVRGPDRGLCGVGKEPQVPADRQDDHLRLEPEPDAEGGGDQDRTRDDDLTGPAGQPGQAEFDHVLAQRYRPRSTPGRAISRLLWRGVSLIMIIPAQSGSRKISLS